MLNKQESKRAEELLEIMMKEVKPRQEALSSHGIYPLLTSVEAITEFMKFHIFAVWDFMSVVKTMQRHLTCVEVPWVPVQHPELARLINDIVLTEESDVNWNNEAQSHFVMYMEAMKEVGVDMSQITLFMSFIRENKSVEDAIVGAKLEKCVADFIRSTFKIINTNKIHMIASSFALSRETLIPEMFLEILNQDDKSKETHKKFTYYLERHVEVDGDEHGPAAINMVKALCGSDEGKWKEATTAAVDAINARERFWDSIAECIRKKVKNM